MPRYYQQDDSLRTHKTLHNPTAQSTLLDAKCRTKGITFNPLIGGINDCFFGNMLQDLIQVGHLVRFSKFYVTRERHCFDVASASWTARHASSHDERCRNYNFSLIRSGSYSKYNQRYIKFWGSFLNGSKKVHHH